jgi:Na+/proline symporter
MQSVVPYLSIDVILLIAFLAINLIIGLRAARQVKTVRDFAIGKKNFSTGTVTATIVATWISGGFMFFGLEHIYKEGLSFFIISLGGGIGLLITAQVLAPRMGEFLNNLSVAESMGDLYGKTVRIISAISGVIGRLGYIAVQLNVIVKVLTMLFENNTAHPAFFAASDIGVTVLAAIILILYSAFGGIRSVTLTDVFQFITFIIFIPILVLIIWNHLESPSQVIETLRNNPNFNFKNVIKWDKQFLSSLFLMLYVAIPTLTPPIFQRVVISKNTSQVKKSFTYAAFIDFFVCTLIAFLGVLLLTDNPHLDPTKLVNYILHEYTYTGFKGLVAIGIIAMSMSTADSDLNACAVTLVNDFIKPLFPKWEMTIGKIRMATLLIGAFALFLAFYTKDLLATILLSASLYMPIVGVPFMMAIFGFRTTPKAVLIGMASGFITVLIWKFKLKHLGLDSVVPGMLANTIFLFASHYLLKQPGGWVGIKDKAPLLVR